MSGGPLGVLRDSLNANLSRRLTFEECDALYEAIAQVEALYSAMELLMHEVEESGNADAKDFGWPKAVKASREAMRPFTPGQDSEGAA